MTIAAFAFAALCPLSFMLGVFAVLILLIMTGNVGRWHTRVVEGVRASEIDRKCNELMLDGWRFSAWAPVRAQQDGADGGGIRTLYNLAFTKWRLN